MYEVITVIVFVIAAIFTKKIDVKGAIVGGVVVGSMMLGTSWFGFVILMLFFVLGSLASHWKREQKEKLGLEQKNEGKRSIINVVSNAGIAAICGISAYAFPENAVIFNLMMTASIASATGDTLSSELGNIYGRKYVNILTFKTDKRGIDGAISLEGTLFGVLGSSIIAFSWCAFYGWSRIFFLLLVAGVIGNLSDSVLGATLQRTNKLNNHSVNFISTLIAALFCCCISLYTQKFL